MSSKQEEGEAPVLGPGDPALHSSAPEPAGVHTARAGVRL